MEEKDLSNGDDPKNLVSNSKKKRVATDFSYPIKGLPETIAFVDVIYTKLGGSEYHDKEDIANAHETNYIAIRQILSTCRQYGLLEIKHGEGYKVTPLFVSIKHPDDDAEFKRSIIESIQNPSPFKFLIEKFKGHPVPQIVGIQNPLIKELNYKKETAIKVAGLFLDSLKSYSLINSKDMIDLSEIRSAGHIPANGARTEKGKNEEEEKPLIEPPKPGILPILIPMKSTNEKAYLYLPENYKEEDLDRILKFVEALK